MSSGTIVALAIGGVAAAAAIGYVIYRSQGPAIKRANPAVGGAAAAGAQARGRTLGDALVSLGGRAVSEGAKLATAGVVRYADTLARRGQVQA
jgi:hypothetical protein